MNKARHLEVTRTMPGPDGTRMPHSLLTAIAAYALDGQLNWTA
ncbi:hypothetical protein ACFYWH_39880 [Streptomyces sp. NPDC003737]